MKIITVILVSSIILAGCEGLGEIIRDKKYTMTLHETPQVKQHFGYNDDLDYVGYIIEGNFGNANKYPTGHLLLKNSR